MNRVFGTLIGIVVVAVLFRACAFIVDQRQFGLVFAFGQLKEVISEPGLQFKLPPPFQNVVYLDKRILTIDTPQPDRVQTSEKRNLLIDSFVKWRISDPRRYWVSFLGSERAAQDRINSLVRDSLNQAVNKRTVNDVTSRERDRAMEEIRVAVQERVKDVGVEIVDVRLKRIDFVPEISESVFRRMQAERNRVANEQRSIGSAEGEKIRADADRQREVLLAEAYRDAQKLKGEGDAKSAAIYAAAFGQNLEFFNFYRSLEAYRSSFRTRSDVLVIDPSSEFFKYMKTPGSAPRPAR
ncbi:MAG TPA: protease modulator HflC [Burkholderiaceae bacterium]|jgi:membrane protease subunit HflC|nr:protease modulator HflC [Burkholderiaceae bacterium]